MIKLNNIKEFFKRDIENGMEEVKKGSVVKYCLFFVLGVVFSTIFHILIYEYHPANFKGKKLENYFISKICSSLNYENIDKMNIVYVSKSWNNIFNDDDSIIVIGEYDTSTNKEKSKNVIVAIFENREKDIIDFILGTDTKYKPTFIIESEPIIGEYVFNYQNMEFHDLTQDGINEIILDFKTNQATSLCKYTLILTNLNNKWNIIQPDFQELQDLIQNNSEDYILVLEENNISVKDVLNNKNNIIYGLSYGGQLDFLYNEMYNFYDFSYRIPLLKPNQGLLAIDTYAHIMYRLDGLNLIVDKSWNFGDIFIGKLLDINELINKYGINIDDKLFYTLP